MEVSWSPPSQSGSASITGYRIFFGSGQNVSVPSLVTGIRVLAGLNKDSVGETVSVRSESDHLASSEVINVTITRKLVLIARQCLVW